MFGFAAAGTTVKTTLGNGAPLSAIADGAGVWRQQLPATKASTSGVAIRFSCSSGESFALSDVLFGVSDLPLFLLDVHTIQAAFFYSAFCL